MLASVISAIVVLSLLIFVHELGHFLACKRVGVGVLKFSLGFGPPVVSRKVGETEYCISAVPLGGFVKMVGEESDGEPEPIEVRQQPNSFAVKPLGHRALIVAAGPLGNLLFAALVFSLLFATGVPVNTASVGEVKVDMPAGKAGIQTGDDIVAVDGKPTVTWDALSSAIRASDGRAVELTIKRGEQELKLSVTPEKSEGRTIFGEPTAVYVIGVGPSGKFVTERSNPVVAIGKGFYETARLSGLTLLTVIKLFERIVPASNLGGPLMIMKMAGEQAHEGLPALLFFMAVLSINLGVLNLLPIPILDGGQLAFMGVEKVLGHPLQVRHREIAQQVGLFLLISLMGFALYNDLHRLVVG